MADSSGRSWLQLSVDASNDAVDAISEALRSHGVNGVAVEPHIVPGDDDGYRATSEASTVSAFIYKGEDSEAQVRAIEEALWHLQAFDLAPISEIQVREVHEEDWANAWKEHFHPLRIGKHVVIKPSWRELDPAPDDIVIQLDPGMAFGTGLHPTTRMVLETMESSLNCEGARVFDVGTGSGILSVAAAKMGADRVLAVDTDEIACRVATENAALNEVDRIVTVCQGTVSQGEGTYEILLANIIASVISEIAVDLSRLMDQRSVLVTSGVIREKSALVEDAFQRVGLDIFETRGSGDWHCYCARLSVRL